VKSYIEGHSTGLYLSVWKQALQEVHEGICVTHVNRHTMIRQMQWFRYFWLTMKRDCVNYITKFHKCKIG